MNVGQLVSLFYAQLWNRWDDLAVESVLAEDFAFRGSLGQESVGRQGWREYRDWVHSGSSDFHNEVVTLVVDGDRAAARLRYSQQGQAAVRQAWPPALIPTATLRASLCATAGALSFTKRGRYAP
ncbi:MAG: ester cyclase [Candidatus Nanopelagicales bacterium]